MRSVDREAAAAAVQASAYMEEGEARVHTRVYSVGGSFPLGTALAAIRFGVDVRWTEPGDPGHIPAHPVVVKGGSGLVVAFRADRVDAESRNAVG